MHILFSISFTNSQIMPIYIAVDVDVAPGNRGVIPFGRKSMSTAITFQPIVVKFAAEYPDILATDDYEAVRLIVEKLAILEFMFSRRC